MIQDGASAGSQGRPQDETTQGDIVFKLKYLKSSTKNNLLLMAVMYGVDSVVFSNAESGIVGIIPYVSSVTIGFALSLIYVDRLWFTFKKSDVLASFVPTIILIVGINATGLSDIGYIIDLALILSFLINCIGVSGIRKKDMVNSTS